MKYLTEQVAVNTSRSCEFIDITQQVAGAVSTSGVKNGMCVVYCPHTTAGITINENADPDVVLDILLTLSKLVPRDEPGYRHAEGNSDAHVKSSLVGVSEHIPIRDGQLMLGRWQGIYFCEFDGPRQRAVIVHISGD